MKKETVEVKSKGDVVSVIEVPVYESLKEAVEALKEGTCLALINRQNKSDQVNAERAAKTRGVSMDRQVSKALKSLPADQQKEILKKLGIDPTMLVQA